ncbi:Detected protein of confused Function [Hibiscus syriacus]|uniref:Detected protein of confused Function n=1 Tax=Hibiscus syriacus TaxID=106335 RepID=A0A6A2Y772_HIBSY|nr:Detected protein of confused Function [Hibiscus syriacus]
MIDGGGRGERIRELLWVFPVIVLTEVLCTCDNELLPRRDASNRTEALKFKLVAIASILMVGALGVSLPILAKKITTFRPENNVFFLIKALVAGVILATAFVHILHDGYESLSSPCFSEKPWSVFHFSGFLTMVSAIATMMIDTFATSCYNKSHFNKALPVNGDEKKREITEPSKTHSKNTKRRKDHKLYLQKRPSFVYRGKETLSLIEAGRCSTGTCNFQSYYMDCQEQLTLQTFQNAIFYLNSFADKGGAKLFVPAGRWLTGSFDLISHLTLWLDKDAVILGSNSSDDWPVVDPLPSYGRGENGTIDGQGSVWWNWFRRETLNYTRPDLIELMNSTGIVISNLTFLNSPFLDHPPSILQPCHSPECHNPGSSGFTKH